MVKNTRKLSQSNQFLAKEALLNPIKQLQNSLQRQEKNRRNSPKNAETHKALKRSYKSENLNHKQVQVSLVHKHKAIHSFHKSTGLPSSYLLRNLRSKPPIPSRLLIKILWASLIKLLPKTRSWSLNFTNVKEPSDPPDTS